MSAELKVKQLLAVLWRRRLVIASVTLLLVIGVYVLVKQLPETYSAQGMLQMEASPFAFAEPKGGLGGPTVDLANVRSISHVVDVPMIPREDGKILARPGIEGFVIWMLHHPWRRLSPLRGGMSA